MKKTQLLTKAERILCLSLAILLLFTVSISSFATDNHDTNPNVLSYYKYKMDTKSGKITEYGFITMQNTSAEIMTKKEVLPSGNCKLYIYQNDESYKIDLTDDYELALANYNLYKKNNNQAFLNGKEIKGKNYKHVYIGSNKFTLKKKDIETIKHESELMAAIAYKCGYSNVALLSSLASTIFSYISESMPTKIVTNCTCYEVRFKNDNSYYIHCYHSKIDYYNGKKIVATENDYSQAIGG